MRFIKKFEKKISKKHKKRLQYILGLEIGFLFGVIFILMFLTVRTPFSAIDYLGNTFSTGIYDAVVVSNLDNNVSKRISNNCVTFPELIDQVNCVKSEIGFIYNYTESHTNGKVINSPDEYEEKGGVCRDIVILQKSIFIRMGWEAYYRYPIPNHVTLTISKKGQCPSGECWVYCDIDGRRYDCN